MKILDRYLLKTFLITFTSVFVILFFIFILQTVWLFIAELAGKDLDFILILKFLLFSMPGIVPLVLPLSILLASIMTFGDLSENYEFAAMKSSGVSLQRAMRSLSVFILLLSFAAFAFANNIIPYSQYKFINFKNNIAQVKPAMAIAEGQFNDVGGFNIKVENKSGDKGNLLTGVTIHQKSTNGNGNTTVIKAKRGELLSSEDSNILQLVLFDGQRYEDIPPKKYIERNKVPFAKSSFQKYNLNMDLSKLNEVDVNQEKISNTSTMLNLSELTYTLDSLNNSYKKEVISFSENIHVGNGITSLTNTVIADTSAAKANIQVKKTPVTPDLLKFYPATERKKIVEIAQSNVSSINYKIIGTKDDFNFKQKDINNHWLSIYDKFVMAYACLLMFFIGAPLGAIIRKGGLGLPIVFAVLIFITFHFINTFGKKIAQEDGITPFLGSWMSSIILTPLALTLTYRATNDINISINFDWFTRPFARIFNRNTMKPVFDIESRLINLDTVKIIQDEDYRSLLKLSDEELIAIVYNSAKDNFDDRKRNKAIDILDKRGIKQTDLFEQGKLFNKNYEVLANASESYNYNSKASLFIYCLTIILGLVAKNNPSKAWIFIVLLLFLVALYISIYKSAQCLEEVGKSLSRRIGINRYVQTILGFPFYIIFHFYNRIKFKKAISESNF